MKKFVVALGVAAMAFGFTSCNNGGSTATSGSSNDSLAILLGEVQGAEYNGYWEQLPDTLKAKLSKDQFIAGFKSIMERDYKADQAYIMGVSTAMNMLGNVSQLQDAGVKFDKTVYINSFAAQFKADSVDQKAMMQKSLSMQKLMADAQDMILKKRQADQQRAQEEAQKAAEPNIKAGKEYVEKQKAADPSIKTTESGVSYKVVKEGTGAKPKKTDMVKVNYVGKHIDGKVFDQSEGEPRQFGLSGVVPGFSEVIQMMAPGAKYVAYIPSDKAYGNQGMGNDIKPGETLVFEIELVEIVDPKAKVTPANRPAPAAVPNPANQK